MLIALNKADCLNLTTDESKTEQKQCALGTGTTQIVVYSKGESDIDRLKRLVYI